MKKIFILIFILAAPAANAATPLPHDVSAFLDDADLCQHMRGEIGGAAKSLKEAREEGRETDRDCAKAAREQKSLSRKYKNDKAMLDQIKSIDLND